MNRQEKERGEQTFEKTLAHMSLLWYNTNQYKNNICGENCMNKRNNLSEYDRNQHSVYMLYYHLILVVKYRRKVIDDAVSDRARQIFYI